MAWLGSLLLIVTASLVVTTLPAPAAATGAADPVATTLTLAGPARVVYGEQATLSAVLADGSGSPLAGATVTLERSAGDNWEPVASGTTDAAGTVDWEVSLTATTPRATYRATYAGDPTYAPAVSAAHALAGYRRDSTLRLHGPREAMAGSPVRLRIRWLADNGAPVPGLVHVQRKPRGGEWATVRRVRLGADGAAAVRARPHVDTRWRLKGVRGSWWQAATSPTHRIRSRPPGRPVAYPAAAPEPARLPAQRPAAGRGANPAVSRIGDGTWRSMVGRSWHRGCPVGRAALRVVRVNYWGFDGFRHRGEIVVHRGVARRVAAAFAAMYRGHFPIRAMYRVDRFGWSRRSHGANDFASMRHDNTSAFNCRWVTGNPGRMSPHSYGRAVDVNPFENPYWSRIGPLPNRWWTGHSHPRIAWRSRSHPVVRIWLRHGFRWTYGKVDSQHVDGRQAVVTAGAFVAE